jgi:hypothetical protein
MNWRTGTDHPCLRALNEAVDELAATEDWLSTPDDAWLPEPEASQPTPSP